MERLLASEIGTEDLDEVCRVLKAGGVVCFPTDTLYGLGVDSANERALEQIYQLKQRSEDKPILLLVDSIRMARALSRPDATFERAAPALWPGPITLITWATAGLSKTITAGGETVGLRWPEHRLAVEIVHRLGRPVTATSANLSGRAPASSIREVIDQLGSRIDLVIDGDPLPPSEPSSVLDLTRQTPTLLREGAVSLEAIRAILDGAIDGVRHEA